MLTGSATRPAGLSRFDADLSTLSGRVNQSLTLPIYNRTRPVIWTSSGSCPLCLTPPCYDFRAAPGRLFFYPARFRAAALRQSRPALTLTDRDLLGSAAAAL